MNQEALIRELATLRERIEEIEGQLAKPSALDRLRPKGMYPAYDVTAGCVLGMFGAATSLLFNVIGSLVVGQHPLQIIRVYLTFPMGEQAFDPRVSNDLLLAVGCCLYMGTGMLLGVPFYLLFKRLGQGQSMFKQFVLATGLSLAIWVINFYGVLSWLQPMLFGGNWIVRDIPEWVGASTHLVFGWTIWLAHPFGVFVPKEPMKETL